MKRRILASENLFSFYISSIAFLSFFTYSVHTPLGYLSLEDIAIGLALFCFALSRVGGQSIRLPNLPVIFLSGITFFLILFSTTIVNTGLDISPVIKYGIFLVAIPASYCLGANQGLSHDFYGRALKNFGLFANLLLAYVLVDIVLGHHSGTGDNYAINVLGQPIYKNQIGEFMIFISSTNFALFGLTKRWLHLACYLGAILSCLVIDVRGPIITTLVISSLIYWKIFGLSVGNIVKLFIIMAVMLLLAYVLYISGLMEAQFDRLINFADTGVSAPNNISSSASRIILWKYTISLIAQNPLFGIGYGGFFYDQTRDWMYGLREPHDNILQILSEGGWIGFLFFMALLYCGFTARSPGNGLLGMKLIALGYLLATLVDIVWVRGTGHLFWILFYLFALYSPPGAQTSATLGSRLRPQIQA